MVWRRLKNQIVMILCPIGLLLLSFNSLRNSASDSRSLETKRPVMHTFYGQIYATNTGTGMRPEDDRHLLEAWAEAWSAAGWDTRILNLGDAMKHPDFEKYDKPLGDNVSGLYDHLCFFRWLAMASAGGGWMSDYDVFPVPHDTNKYHYNELPEDGKLTVYEFTKEGGVPSLISGSASEWDRLAHLLFDKSYDNKISSDMYALIDLHQTHPDAFVLADKVLKGHLALKEHLKEDKCRHYRGYDAVHFSHYAIHIGKEAGVLEKDAGPNSRPMVAKNWIREWIKVCGVEETVQ